MRADYTVEETTFSLSNDAPSRPADEQGPPRNLTILRVGCLVVEGRRELCLFRSISAGGLKAHAYSPLDEGQRVSVELKTDQQIDGHVSWVNGGNIGIAFDELIDVEGMLAADSAENGWKNRMPRVEVDRLATLRHGAQTYGVNTCDISQGGVKLETDRAFEAGDEVVISLEKYSPLQGVVRWYRGGQCGISFNHIVPFRDLMVWLRQD